jgi:hypothetical protein
MTTVMASRRTLFWVAVCAACLLTLAGTVVAVTGYFTSAGPGRVVRNYFAALSRGDARAALGYGALPDGPRELLTGPVLRAQQQVGRIGPVSVIAVNQDHETASVRVHYAITFASDSTVVDDQVPVIKHGGSWRLAATAVPVDLTLKTAQHRASVAGAVVPAGRPLVFPGAVPIAFDAPALQLAERWRIVRFEDTKRAALEVTVTSVGQKMVQDAVAAALRNCLGSADPDPLCPMPTGGRAVPGTVRGAIDNEIQDVRVTVAPDADGRIEVTGHAQVTGSYTELTFDNQRATKPVNRLTIQAHASARTPNEIVWDVP